MAVMYSTLITPAELRRLMDQGAPLKVFDCSFDLMQPAAGAAQFLERHIPGARHMDLEHDLSAAPGAPRASGGRHPLPTREDFAARLAARGVNGDTQVVVYDRQGVNYAGRLWWMLKWCGHEAVAVLDGGLQAWEAEGGAWAQGNDDTTVPPGNFRLGSPLARLVDTASLARDLGTPGLTVLDARGTPRFLGESEPLDPVAGHIPGALNRPFGQNIGTDGRFKPAGQLRAEFLALLGQRAPANVVHHCGSGVSAVPNVLAMEIAGLGRAALYAGSWSEWCNTPGLPVARG